MTHAVTKQGSKFDPPEGRAYLGQELMRKLDKKLRELDAIIHRESRDAVLIAAARLRNEHGASFSNCEIAEVVLTLTGERIPPERVSEYIRQAKIRRERRQQKQQERRDEL